MSPRYRPPARLSPPRLRSRTRIHLQAGQPVRANQGGSTRGGDLVMSPPSPPPPVLVDTALPSRSRGPPCPIVPPDRAGVTAEHPAQRSTIAVAITPRARSTKQRWVAELVSPAQIRRRALAAVPIRGRLRRCQGTSRGSRALPCRRIG